MGQLLNERMNRTTVGGAVRHRAVAALAAGVVCFACSGEARATLHLVASGDDWSKLSGKVRPGDEILLMPGRHVSAVLEDLHGTKANPIIIRGLDAARPALIGARHEGIRLVRPQYVILRDLRILGADKAGLIIEDGRTDQEDNADAEPWLADVRIERVYVGHTGPVGDFDGIRITGVRNVIVRNCIVEGWGGSAIDIVGSHQVDINNCAFRGLSDYSQESGVQVRGGSSFVRITQCRFIDSGKRAVNAGGWTDPQSFRPAIPNDAQPATQFEATHVRIERCLFVGGDTAVAFVGSSRCAVYESTIVHPGRWVFRILQEQDDARFAPTSRGVIGRNLIVYDPKKVRMLADVGPNVDAESFRFEQNLWWAEGAESADLTHLPGGDSFPAVTNVDPKLDTAFRPTAAGARAFGYAAAGE